MPRFPLVFAMVVAVAASAAGQLRRPGRVIPPATPVDPQVADAKALESAGLKPDDADLLMAYFRQRTLSDTDAGRIQAVIRRFGADDFEERLRAQAEAERFGPAAVGPLREAQSDADPEVAYRASESLKRLEKVPHASVAAAAVRALARVKPAGAAAVLIGFLPLADDDLVADEISHALTGLAVRNGKADPALIMALSDPQSVRRAAAGVALIEGGPSDRRIRIPDAYPKVKSAALSEPDVETKFQLLFAMLTASGEKDAVGPLIDLLPDLPRGRLWQAEDYLGQLAGEAAPDVRFGRKRDTLNQARDAWQQWWAKSATNTDLGQFRYRPRISGRTLLVLMDVRYSSVGTVIELGPDMKERWKITGLGTTLDARVLSDGNVLIAEQGGRLTLRDTAGRILPNRITEEANRNVLDVQQLQVLPNGNLLVVCRNLLAEYKKENGEELLRYDRPNGDIAAACRLADGSTAVLVMTGPNHCTFLDAKGKEIPDRTLKMGMPYYQAGIDAPGPDRLLVTEMQRVVEYDLKEGKEVWAKQVVGQPRSVQRLPNGNTLIVDSGGGATGRVVEVTPEGEEVWIYVPSGKLSGLMPSRAYRR